MWTKLSNVVDVDTDVADSTAPRGLPPILTNISFRNDRRCFYNIHLFLLSLSHFVSLPPSPPPVAEPRDKQKPLSN